MDNYTSIEKYINTFDPINEGSRNATLYQKGLLLRSRFGLTGDAMVSALLQVNDAKCTLPLPEADVRRIAGSVDRSDAPIGESTGTFASDRQQSRKPPKTEHRTWHCTCTDSVPVDTLLAKTVSVYPHCRANTPNGALAISEVLETFRTGGKSIAKIEAVRNESDKDKRNELKQRIAAIVFGSEPHTERKNAACKHNGIICLDFDGIPEDALESAKQTIAAVPYIFAAGLSVGGSGVFALAHYEGTPDLKKLLLAMQADFPCEIDKSRSDLCGLRYVTFDPDITIKDKVCPAILTESKLDKNTNAEVNIHADENIEPALQWQPFPLDTLPSQLRLFVTEVSRSIGIDSSNTAACVLSIVSGVIGRMFRLKIKQGYQEHAMLWVALIADSGLGKSPALDYARKPIDRLQINAWETYKSAKEQYDTDFEEYQRQQRSRKKEDIIVPVKPIEPVMSCYSVSDATTEALLPILSDNPFGMCLIRDELAAFFNGMDAYRNGSVDRQIFIEIHGGRFVQAHRKTGTRYLAAKTPSLSIIGGIQSDVIRRTVKSEPEFMTTGFGARFLMVYPPAEPIRWNSNVADSTVLASYEGLIDTLLQYREGFTPDEPGIVSMTPGATSLIFGFQNRHATDSLDIADGNIRYVENKAGMHCARLALILHVVHCVENGIDPVSPVSQETMRQAIALTEWFLNEAHRIYAMFREDGEPAESELTDEQRTVMKVLAKHQPATERDIKRHCAVIREKWETGKLEKVLIELLELDRVTRQSENGKGNRGTTWWKIKNSFNDSNANDTNSAEHGKYGINGSVIGVIGNENDFSTPDVVEGFGVYRNPSDRQCDTCRYQQKSHPDERCEKYQSFDHVQCVAWESSPEGGTTDVPPDVISDGSGINHDPICPNCVHHRPETYPTQGLCAKEYCQMDLQCHDFKEITKTESLAG